MDKNDHYGGESSSLSLAQLWKRFRGDDAPPETLGTSKEYNVDMIPKIAAKLMYMHEECAEGNYNSIKSLREADPPRRVLSYIQQNPIVGGSFLLTYTTGYVAPLLLAASFAGALQLKVEYDKLESQEKQLESQERELQRQESELQRQKQEIQAKINNISVQRKMTGEKLEEEYLKGEKIISVVEKKHAMTRSTKEKLAKTESVLDKLMSRLRHFLNFQSSYGCCYTVLAYFKSNIILRSYILMCSILRSAIIEVMLLFSLLFM